MVGAKVLTGERAQAHAGHRPGTEGSLHCLTAPVTPCDPLSCLPCHLRQPPDLPPTHLHPASGSQHNATSPAPRSHAAHTRVSSLTTQKRTGAGGVPAARRGRRRQEAHAEQLSPHVTIRQLRYMHVSHKGWSYPHGALHRHPRYVSRGANPPLLSSSAACACNHR